MDLPGLAYSLGRTALNAYFRRPNSRRGRGRKRGRGSRGMARSGARCASRAPTRSVMQGSFSGSIRQYYTLKAKGSWYKTISVTSLLSDSFASLKTQFAEVQIKAIRVYYTPNAATTSSGNYAMALIDSDNIPVKQLTYASILSLPGSTCRKLFQGAGCHWKWTEPSDAEFRSTSSAEAICAYYVATQDETADIGGDVVVDASLTLRSDGSLLGHPLERMILENEWSDEVLERVQTLIQARRSTGEYVMA